MTLENFRDNKDYIVRYVSENYFYSVIVYSMMYLMFAVMFLPGAAILSIAGGFLFGMRSVVYINLAVTLGDTITLLFVRYLVGRSIQRRYAEQLKWINRQVDLYGYSYFLLMRLLPVIPFFMINMLAGMTKIPLRTYVWTTSIGIIPASMVYTYAGVNLHDINSLDEIVSLKMWGVFVLIALLLILPLIIKKYFHNKHII
ncbi:MAG: TVP38/TMEM64 family protein [Candidatus Brocadiales bacterium]|nr:TVP38/TMEM64 family protein [Candidatus Brocadiales bacterium]